jgi:sterol desaturase/sphingolipid hydroxylase (fatty acid hydroxylase superfamily)
VAYELAFQANTLFHHSNVRLPLRLERALNTILVTPRMHGIHHSQREQETNSNYGVVFPWWDRLHRTLGLNVPQSEIVIGVPGYSLVEDNRLISVLTAPFRKQREYWRKPAPDMMATPEMQGAELRRDVPRGSVRKPTILAE